MNLRPPAVAQLAMVALLTACTAAPGPADTTIPATTTTEVPTTTSTTIEVRTCPAPPYEISFLPLGVGDDGFDPAGVEPDVWTSVGGTNSLLLGREDDSVAVALIRGALPAVDWPGDKGVVQIDGVDAAVGPHADGTWVAGWAVEPEERCDLYSMVFYPPWNPRDVEQVLLGMRRVPG